MKNLKQILSETLANSALYNVNVYRSIVDLIIALNDNSYSKQVLSIKNELGSEQNQQSLLEISRLVIQKYTGCKQYNSNSAADIIEQVLDFSDVSSDYFDGSDCHNMITQSNVKDQLLIKHFDDLQDKCDQFRLSAERVNEKCQGLITIKIKDLLDEEQQLIDELETRWLEVKQLANSINHKYSLIKQLFAILKNNRL